VIQPSGKRVIRPSIKRVVLAIAALLPAFATVAAVADHYVGPSGNPAQAWNGLAKISMCDPTWGDATHPEDQGCHYFTITREAQGTVAPKDIEGDQTGFEGAVATDAQCRLSWDETQSNGQWDDTPNQVRVRLYVPGTDLFPTTTSSAFETVITSSMVTNDTYGTHTFGGAGHYTFPCGLDDSPFATGGTAYFGAVEVWMELETTYDERPTYPDYGIAQAVSTSTAHNACGADTDQGVSNYAGCPSSLVSDTNKYLEAHPGYLRADVESSTTTRIEKNGGSTNVTSLVAGDVPNARMDWSYTPEPQVQRTKTGATLCTGGMFGSGQVNCGGTTVTAVDNGLLHPTAKAHFIKHGDAFGNWTTTATCTYNSGNGRCDATFPAIDQSYVNGAAYDVDFEFTGPLWNGIPVFEFRDTGHSQPYPPTVWDSAPDGTVASPNLLGTPTVTITTTGGATTTTTTAPTGSSGGILLGWYQGDGSIDTISSKIAADKASSFSFGHARVYVSKGHWSDGIESSNATESTSHLNSEGTSVSWSVKPPAWSGTTSPWALAAADTTQLDTDLVALNTDASSHSIPYNTITIGHEPHDQASDWLNAKGLHACTDHNCDGTIADYQLLYHNLMHEKMTACSGECTHVKIAYIGVVSNMIRHVGNNPVGSDDPLMPADRDSSGNVKNTCGAGSDPCYNFDVLGGDPYNWGCFREVGAGADGVLGTADDVSICADSTHTPKNEWTSFENMVDNSASNYSLLDLAQLYNKPVFLTEFASHPGCTGNTKDDSNWPGLWCNGANTSDSTWHRGNWFDAAATYLKTDPEAKKYIYAIDYFHTDHTSSANGHDWTFISTATHTAPLASSTVTTNCPSTGGTDETGYCNWLTDFAKDSFFKETAVGFYTDFTPNS
jgi:hypothetical protein